MGLKEPTRGVTLGDVASRDFIIVGEDAIVSDVIERMWRKGAFMAIVVRARGVPRGGDVVGVITKEHVADSRGEQREDLSELTMKESEFWSYAEIGHRLEGRGESGTLWP